MNKSSRSAVTVLFLVGALLSGCGTTKENVQSSGIQVSAELKQKKVALVLGAGASKGFAHIGVITELINAGIPIDMVVGCSVGSLVGALYASNPDDIELLWKAANLKKEDIFDFSWLNLISLKTMGPIKGERLEKFILNSLEQKNIEELKVPYYAVAVNLLNGTPVVFDRGSIATAVRASCSIPGIFHPVEYQGYVLVDGGVVTPLPCDVARQKGADIVIAVDIGSDPEISEAGNMVDVMLQSIDIMNRENAKCKQKMADIVIRPVIKGIGLMDFSQKKELIDAGREAARAKIDEIRFLLM